MSLLAGLALVVPAAPLLVSELLMVPGDRTLKGVRRHQVISDGAVATLIDSRERALLWHERGRTWTDLGLAYLLRANRGAQGGRHAALEMARAAVTNGLALAPANPYAWLRLARLQLALDGPKQAVADAVSLGLATGPYESGLLWSKLDSGLRVWGQLDAADRATLVNLLPEALRRDRSRTVRLAARTGHLKLLFSLPAVR